MMGFLIVNVALYSRYTLFAHAERAVSALPFEDPRRLLVIQRVGGGAFDFTNQRC